MINNCFMTTSAYFEFSSAVPHPLVAKMPEEFKSRSSSVRLLSTELIKEGPRGKRVLAVWTWEWVAFK